jgi:hypothetical protein
MLVRRCAMARHISEVIEEIEQSQSVMARALKENNQLIFVTIMEDSK